MADGDWERTFECTDVAGRPRVLRLFPTDNGRMAFKVPPGELAVITLAVVPLIQHALNELAIEAYSRRSRDQRES